MYQKILVPLDGSTLAECALPHVKNLAGGGKVGKIILLSVAVFNIPYGSIGADFDFGSFRTEHIKESQDYLALVQSKLAAEGIEVETLVTESGNPAQTITEYAQTNGVDLIVIATHGYTGVRRMLVGSVAFKILHESHVPVLLIRPEAA
jgi:nucleotide-binding universal stress UspA family protein